MAASSPATSAAAAWWFATCLAAPGIAAAQAPADPPAVDPLALQAVDAPQDAPGADSGLRLEAWAQDADLRAAPAGTSQPPPRHQQRLVLDFRREWAVAASWKLGLSTRLEQVRGLPGPSGGRDSEARLALREAYASWGWAPGRYLDIGRVQWRNGVASGFNPSDFLKRGAVLDLGTQNPQALRENRLGTVMLRQQWLGDWGSVQGAWIPKLSSKAGPRAAPRSPAWERTNGADAALLRWAPGTPEAWSAEALAYARAGEPVRWGANATALLSDSLVAYGEWAGGRAFPRAPVAGGAPAPRRDQELAAGATWTSPWGWTATLERQQSTTPGSSDAWFARWAWDSALGRRDFNLAAFLRQAASHGSRLWQVDARWHLDDRHSVALAWGGNHGGPARDPGRPPVRRYGTVAWSVYF